MGTSFQVGKQAQGGCSPALLAPPDSRSTPCSSSGSWVICLHFTDGETEAQRGGPRARQWQSQDFRDLHTHWGPSVLSRQLDSLSKDGSCGWAGPPFSWGVNAKQSFQRPLSKCPSRPSSSQATPAFFPPHLSSRWLLSILRGSDQTSPPPGNLPHPGSPASHGLP